MKLSAISPRADRHHELAVQRPSEESGTRDLLFSRSTRPLRPWVTVVALGIYGALALWANWPEYPGDPHLIRAGDLSLDTWLLAWTPHALLTGQSIFATNYINFPAGVSIAQQTSMPLLGLLTAPLTLLVSPVSSMSLLLWLSPTLSAGAMFWVLRRFVRRDFSAFVGGLLYGFSTYMVCVQANHLHLAFVPLPPLIMYLAYKVFRDHRWRDGCVLGLLVSAQMYIAAEVACTTLIILGFAILVFGAGGRQWMWGAFRPAIGPLVFAGVIVIVVSLPYVLALTTGPYRYTAPTAWIGGRMSDLLTPVLPTSLERFGPASWKATANAIVQGDNSENGAYLGIPLILLLAGATVYLRRRRVVVGAFIVILIAFVLSLGVDLQVNGHLTDVWLPDHLLLHAALLQDLIPVRFALYEFLFGALIVATIIDVILEPPRFSVRAGVFGALAVASVVSLLPQWPAPVGPTGVPPFFTSSAVNRIPRGAIVMMTPYPSSIDPGPSLFIAMAKFRYRMIGGYAMFDDGGSAHPNPIDLQPDDVTQYISGADTNGGELVNAMPIPPLSHKLVCDTRTFLERNRIQVVLAADVGDDPAADRSLFEDAIGAPTDTSGGVYQWYGVQRLVTKAASGSDACTQRNA